MSYIYSAKRTLCRFPYPRIDTHLVKVMNTGQHFYDLIFNKIFLTNWTLFKTFLHSKNSQILNLFMWQLPVYFLMIQMVLKSVRWLLIPVIKVISSRFQLHLYPSVIIHYIFFLAVIIALIKIYLTFSSNSWRGEALLINLLFNDCDSVFVISWKVLKQINFYKTSF